MVDKWVKAGKRGWMGDHAKSARRQVEKESQEEQDDIRMTITHIPLRCPGCKSRSIRCYGADRPVLYYRCQDCDLKFKVFEVEKG